MQLAQCASKALEVFCAEPAKRDLELEHRNPAEEAFESGRHGLLRREDDRREGGPG